MFSESKITLEINELNDFSLNSNIPILHITVFIMMPQELLESHGQHAHAFCSRTRLLVGYSIFLTKYTTPLSGELNMLLN